MPRQPDRGRRAAGERAGAPGVGRWRGVADAGSPASVARRRRHDVDERGVLHLVHVKVGEGASTYGDAGNVVV